MERKPLTLGKISFTDVKNGNFDFERGKNSCVIMGLSVQAPDMKELQDDATEFFHSTGFVTNDAYVVRMLRVSPAVCTTTDIRIFVSSNKNRNKTKGGVK